jgi:hypothetical protein
MVTMTLSGLAEISFETGGLEVESGERGGW